MHEKRIEINGDQLLVRYRIVPGTDPILFLHGLSCAGSHYIPAFRCAALDGYSLIVPDLPGFGESAKLSYALYSIGAAAARTAKLLEVIGVSGVIVVAHSMGAAVAVELYRAFPDLVSGVIFCEGNLTRKDAYWSGNIAGEPLERYEQSYENLKGRWHKLAEGMKLTANVADSLALTLKTYDQAGHEAMHAYSKSLVETTFAGEYVDCIKGIRIPVYYVAGDKSAGAWDIPADLLAQGEIKDRFRVIPASGHMMMLDNPDGFYSGIAGICAEIAHF